MPPKEDDSVPVKSKAELMKEKYWQKRTVSEHRNRTALTFDRVSLSKLYENETKTYQTK